MAFKTAKISKWILGFTGIYGFFFLTWIAEKQRSILGESQGNMLLLVEGGILLSGYLV